MPVASSLPDPTSAVVAAGGLGLSALAEMVAGAQGGIVIVDAAAHYTYANPSACRMLGYSLDQLRARDFPDMVPERENARMLARFAAQLEAGYGTFTCVVLGSDGVEREVVCSTFAIEMHGVPHGVAVLWDLTRQRAADRTAVALTQTGAMLVGAGDTGEVLTSIARHAVEGSAALACGISVMNGDHMVVARGGFGAEGPSYVQANPVWSALSEAPVDEVIDVMTGGSIVLGDAPGQPVVVLNARSKWRAHPVMKGFADNLKDLAWDTVVCLPLSWEDRVFGLFSAYLPSSSDGPADSAVAFYAALADQAAVAVMNERLALQAGQAAALLERGRLARELHDSVSQGLFSMTMHARAAQLLMAKAGLDASGPVGRSIRQLADLTRGALAEMRALIFELRPGALIEEGLVGALRKQAAALSARELLAITVNGPETRLQLAPGVEEHLYRIVSEATHNVVKHAQADNAEVNITIEPGLLRITVIDDGIGFDHAARRAGHLGLTTMAQRAEAIGAAFTVTRASTGGTRVVLSSPYDPSSVC